MLDLGALETSRRPVVQVLKGGVGDFELGVLEAQDQAAVVFPEYLALDQKAEALCSPDFTQPGPAARQRAAEHEVEMIRITRRFPR